MSRRLQLIIGGVATVLVATVASAVLYVQQAAGAVPAQEAITAIARVHHAVFGDAPLIEVGCFTLHPGHTTTEVFVVDASYTNYETIHCDQGVQRDGGNLRVTVVQSWDDGTAPTDSGLLGWARRIFYQPPSHTWSYIVQPGGQVITLPEHGVRTPQSYYH